MIRVILDLETLNIPPFAERSIITEIGLLAVDESFDILGQQEIFPCPWRQLAAGRTFSANTIRWHLNKGTELSSEDRSTPADAAVIVREFFLRFPADEVWMQGPDFDRPIIETFLAEAGQSLPWNFTNSRDSRTLWKLAHPGVRHPKRPHTAIGDCLCTLDAIRDCYIKLGLFDPRTPQALRLPASAIAAAHDACSITKERVNLKPKHAAQ